jgi:hypothetical protein
MSIQIMPTRTDLPHYEVSVELEGTTYVFEFRWNARASGWFMTIKTQAEEVLVTGRRVVLNSPLLRQYKNRLGLPPGNLLAVDTTGANQEAGLKDLGSRVLLLYFEAADLPT